MKKLAFLILILCFSATLAAAQKTVRKRTKKPAVQTNENQASENSKKKPNPSSNQFDTPLRILEKPRASRTDGQDCSQGKVVLRVTFLASGEIGLITVISGMGNGLTESSIEAAKKIKFVPAIKDGKAVTVTKPVEYAFTLY